MPKVFVPQVPSRIDKSIREWVPTVNLSSAEKFGELVILLPPEANRMHIAPVVAAMKEKMAEFGPEDYVVAVGDPSFIAVAAAIATMKNHRALRLLKWDRMNQSYNPMEIQL